MKGAKKYRTAKDFINMWSRLYNRETRRRYIPNYTSEGTQWKQLMSEFKDRELMNLITFAFSNSEHTAYLRRQGFPLRLFVSSINQFQAIIANPGSDVPEKELDLRTPYWDDGRLSFMWGRIQENDIDALLCHVPDVSYWNLLFAKMSRQGGTINSKIRRLYDMWKMKETYERNAVCKTSDDELEIL